MFKWLGKQVKSNFSIRSNIEGAANASKKLTGYETSKNFAKDTVTIAKQVLNPHYAISRAKVETFAEAQARLKVTDEDLTRNLRNFAWITLISVAFALLLATIAVASAVLGHFFQTFVATSMLAFTLTNAFKYSFRAFQIKHKNLCGVEVWLASKNEWLQNPLAK